MKRGEKSMTQIFNPEALCCSVCSEDLDIKNIDFDSRENYCSRKCENKGASPEYKINRAINDLDYIARMNVGSSTAIIALLAKESLMSIK
jgi:hypothetical protein